MLPFPDRPEIHDICAGLRAQARMSEMEEIDAIKDPIHLGQL